MSELNYENRVTSQVVVQLQRKTQLIHATHRYV